VFFQAGQCGNDLATTPRAGHASSQAIRHAACSRAATSPAERRFRSCTDKDRTSLLSPAADKSPPEPCSVECHEPTYAVQQICSLLDHFVGAREQHGRHVDAKRLGG